MGLTDIILEMDSDKSILININEADALGLNVKFLCVQLNIRGQMSFCYDLECQILTFRNQNFSFLMAKCWLQMLLMFEIKN